MSIHEKLSAIQSQLHAPKSQRNDFGKYNYRSCEDILESLKPLLKEQCLTLTLTDAVENIGSRFYVVATAQVHDGKDAASVRAYAREEEIKKGMDGAQITGAASSYARKYALNGLFCIDDTKDADSMDNRKELPVQKPVAKPATATPAKAPVKVPEKPAETKKPDRPTLTRVLEAMTDAKDITRLQQVYDRAKTFEWSEEDAGGIETCYGNMHKRLTKVDPEKEIADAERAGMKAS